MTHIIAGHLQLQDQVADVINELVKSGVERGHITSFYINPPGQHDLYPIGGDRDQSPGAKDSDKGMAYGLTTGGVVGAAIGLAGTPMLGPLAPALGALVGAHVGSLSGSMLEMKDKNEAEVGAENAVPQRRGGMLVAVAVNDDHQQSNVVGILRAYGAEDLERNAGVISDGEWRDFDPLLPPEPLVLQ